MKTLIILLALSTAAHATERRAPVDTIPASRDYSKPYAHKGGASPQEKLFTWNVLKKHEQDFERQQKGLDAVKAGTTAAIVVLFILAM